MLTSAFRRVTLVLSAVAMVIVFQRPVRAAEIKPFYQGKQIRLIVGSGAGGGYDVYARLFAAYFGRHIDGDPQVVVENMTGASSLNSAAYMATSAPRDGTVLNMPLSSVPTAPLLQPAGAKFDPTQFKWIGSITKDVFVGMVWHTSPIQTLDDLKTKNVVMGADSLGAAGADIAVIARAFFGLKIKLVLGYADSVAVKDAIEKGEVEGTFANQLTDLFSTRPSWLRDNLVRIIVQDGFEKSPALPNVPLLSSLAKTDEDRQALRLLLARQDFAKPILAPPGTPAERVTQLRRAFDSTVRDPDFLAGAAKAKLPVDSPMSGGDLQSLVEQVGGTPRPIVDRVLRVFADYK